MPRLHISGMSGNEIFCLAEKGLTPGEIVVGNSVVSIGVGSGWRRKPSATAPSA